MTRAFKLSWCPYWTSFFHHDTMLTASIACWNPATAEMHWPRHQAKQHQHSPWEFHLPNVGVCTWSLHRKHPFPMMQMSIWSLDVEMSPDFCSWSLQLQACPKSWTEKTFEQHPLCMMKLLDMQNIKTSPYPCLLGLPPGQQYGSLFEPWQNEMWRWLVLKRSYYHVLVEILLPTSCSS